MLTHRHGSQIRANKRMAERAWQHLLVFLKEVLA